MTGDMPGITGNNVTGNKVEGDLTIGTKITIESPIIDHCAFRQLLSRSENLCATDPEYCRMVEELSDFLIPRPGRTVIGLKAKLNNGGRLDLLNDAEYLSNKFAKRVARDQFSQADTAFYLHCLSVINSTFTAFIRPLIQVNAPVVAIDAAIHSKIIVPLFQEVSSVRADTTTETLRGMLYFLTGKCHLIWDNQ